MNINPVNTDKTVEYQNNLQARFKDVISSKDEHSGMFSGTLGESLPYKWESLNSERTACQYSLAFIGGVWKNSKYTVFLISILNI